MTSTLETAPVVSRVVDGRATCYSVDCEVLMLVPRESDPGPVLHCTTEGDGEQPGRSSAIFEEVAVGRTGVRLHSA